MQFVITPYAEKIEPFVWYEGAFNDQELNWLQNKARTASSTALTGGGNTPDIRRSTVSWMNNNQENEWVFERLAWVVAKLNMRYYRFDLTGFGENLQLTQYSHLDTGMYSWHQDYGTGISRKLSIVLQLTDPSEFEGGNLQVMSSNNVLTVRKQRGLIAAFPSYITHQVTPVTSGTRQTLVAWISGPAFK